MNQLNTVGTKLEAGTFTWSQLCNLLNWSNNTSAKHNQLLELQRWCLYNKVGRYYHIVKVLEKPKTKETFYKPNNDYTNHPQVLVPKHLLDYTSMIVYKIQLGNIVYIGATTRPRNRISEHFNGYVNDMTCDILKKGATFEVLHHVTTTESDLFKIEKEYIQEYVNAGVYTVINDRHNNCK